MGEFRNYYLIFDIITIIHPKIFKNVAISSLIGQNDIISDMILIE